MIVLTNDVKQGVAPETLQQISTGYVVFNQLLGGKRPWEGTFPPVGNYSYRTRDVLGQLCFTVGEAYDLTICSATPTTCEPNPGFNFMPLKGCPTLQVGCAGVVLMNIDSEIPHQQTLLVAMCCSNSKMTKDTTALVTRTSGDAWCWIPRVPWSSTGHGHTKTKTQLTLYIR